MTASLGFAQHCISTSFVKMKRLPILIALVVLLSTGAGADNEPQTTGGQAGQEPSAKPDASLSTDDAGLDAIPVDEISQQPPKNKLAHMSRMYQILQTAEQETKTKMTEGKMEIAERKKLMKELRILREENSKLSEEIMEIKASLKAENDERKYAKDNGKETDGGTKTEVKEMKAATKAGESKAGLKGNGVRTVDKKREVEEPKAIEKRELKMDDNAPEKTIKDSGFLDAMLDEVKPKEKEMQETNTGKLNKVGDVHKKKITDIGFVDPMLGHIKSKQPETKEGNLGKLIKDGDAPGQ